MSRGVILDEFTAKFLISQIILRVHKNNRFRVIKGSLESRFHCKKLLWFPCLFISWDCGRL